MKSTQYWAKIFATAALAVVTATANAQTAPGQGQPGQGAPGTGVGKVQNPGQRGNRVPLGQIAMAWSKAEGKPVIPTGHSVGYYIWHEGNTVYVVTTNENDKGNVFGGRIRVQGGTLGALTPLHNEKVDHAQETKPNVMTFHFVTHEGTDGVKFTVTGGRFLVFNLRFKHHKTDHIFLGRSAVEATHDPVVLDLSK